MSDHDFEKQVQQKMEQLRLRPSDAVWTKVDTRIRKERRRRRVILWVPLFLLCVVAGGYFYFNTSSDNNKFTASELNSTQHSNTNSNNPSNASEPAPSAGNSSNNATVTEPATTVPVNDQAAPSVTTENAVEPSAPKVAPAQTPAEAPAASVAKTTTQPAVKPASTPAATNNVIQPKNDLAGTTVKNKTNGRNPKGKKPVVVVGNDQSVAVISEKQSSVKHKRIIVKKNNDQPVANQPAGKDPVQTDLAQSDSASLVNNNTVPQNNITTDAGNVVAQPKTTDSATINPVMAKASPKKKPAPVAAPIKKKKPSSWSYGIIAEGGASHISKGSPFTLLSKKNNEPEDLAQSSPVSGNQTLVGNPAGFTQLPEKKPSELKSSLAWSAGGFVQKQLNKRISVSAGVQYSYFSMKTDVGEYMKSAIAVTNANYDQVVSEFYQGRSAYAIGGGLATYSYPRPPQEQEYTNKYHFLEIPLKIHWRVTGDEAALPIIVDGGLSVAKLIATNALHYDGANDVYYKDYDYFNKVQAGISAGVNVALFNESKHPVWIGPNIKYQLSNLITSDLSSGQHLWSFGLGAKFFLRK